jgi:phosphoserine aminotransferase
MQFSAIPYNLLGGDNKVANYLTTGAWSESAFKECKKIAQPHEVWQGSGSKFVTVPDVSTWNINKDASYFHYCDNETIHGVEFPGAESFPFDAIPENQTLICDMSSNFCSRPINCEKIWIFLRSCLCWSPKECGSRGCVHLSDQRRPDRHP